MNLSYILSILNKTFSGVKGRGSSINYSPPLISSSSSSLKRSVYLSNLGPILTLGRPGSLGMASPPITNNSSESKSNFSNLPNCFSNATAPRSFLFFMKSTFGSKTNSSFSSISVRFIYSLPTYLAISNPGTRSCGKVGSKIKTSPSRSSSSRKLSSIISRPYIFPKSISYKCFFGLSGSY